MRFGRVPGSEAAVNGSGLIVHRLGAEHVSNWVRRTLSYKFSLRKRQVQS